MLVPNLTKMQLSLGPTTIDDLTQSSLLSLNESLSPRDSLFEVFSGLVSMIEARNGDMKK